ncbi:hypothetical protein IP88_05240 [alpha proteobacterium AAP81b]|nr:hypothetical protein IP88_05240 [alpha proteobacterium AAP81b]
MKRHIAIAAATVAAAAGLLVASQAGAALQPGAKAPAFDAPGYLAGNPVKLSLAAALAKGPVVVYFFPAAHTSGCNLEAHLFSEAIDAFKAEKTTVIGITSGNLDQLADFSKETEHCGGKFAVAADPGAKIARSYNAVMTMKPDWSDRTSYVIGRDGTVIHAYSNMSPKDHVAETLAAVKAYNKK